MQLCMEKFFVEILLQEFRARVFFGQKGCALQRTQTSPRYHGMAERQYGSQ